MVDVARLQIEADSRQIRTAQRELDTFGRQAQTTDRNVTQLNRGLRNSGQAMDAMGTAAGRLRGLLATLGISVTASALVKFVQSTFSAVDELGKFSRQVGISAEALQAYDFAARQSGVSVDGLRSGLARLTRNIAEARDGTGELSKISSQLNIDLTDTDSAFNDIADAVANAATESDGAKIAMAAFGREGLQLTRILRSGSQGLSDYRDRARQLGIIIGDDLIKQTEAFNDMVDRVGSQLKVSFQRGFLQGMIGEAKDLQDVVANKDFQVALENIGKFMGAIVEYAGIAARGLNIVVGQLRELRGAVDLENELEVVRRIQVVRADIARLEEQQARTGVGRSGGGLSPAQLKALTEYRAELDRLTESFRNMRRSHPAVSGDPDAPPLIPSPMGDNGLAELAAAQLALESARRELEQFAGSFEQLRRQLDPTYGEMMRLEEALDILDRAWLEGMITIPEYTALLNKLYKTVSDVPQEMRESPGVWETAWGDAIDRIDGAFIDLFESGLKSFRDFASQLKNIFRRLLAELAYEAIKKPILISLGLGGATGSAGASAGVAGAAGGIGEMVTMASAITKLTNLVSTGFASVGAAVGSIGAAIQYGVMPFSEQAMMLAAQEAGMGTLAGTLGAAGTVLAGAAIGYFVGGMISGGYSAIGKSGNVATVGGTAVGAAIGFAFGGPIGAAIGAALGGTVGGLINRLFGRKLADVGIRGTFGGEAGFAGEEYRFERGGLFRSDRTRTSELNADLERAFAESFAFLQLQNAAMLEALQIGSQAIFEFTEDVKISLWKLSPEETEERIAETFNKLSDSMIDAAINLERFAMAGETSSETLVRLYTAIMTVNTALDMLGLQQFGTDLLSGLREAEIEIEGFSGSVLEYMESLTQGVNGALANAASEAEIKQLERNLSMAQLRYDIGLDTDMVDDLAAAEKALAEARERGAMAIPEGIEIGMSGPEMADQLINLMGGIEAFSQSTQKYFELFYSQAEQLDYLERSLTDALGQLDMALPESREAFRELVTGLDLTTEQGRQAFAMLMALAPGFDALMTGLEGLGEIAADTTQDLAAIARERETLERRLLELQGDTTELRRRELEALDPTNRALQEMIWTLEDAANTTIPSLVGLAENSITGLFQTILNEAESAEQARVMAAERAEQMIYDAIAATVIDQVSRLMYDSVILPLSQSVMAAALEAAAVETSSAAISGQMVAAGGTVAANNLAVGSAAGGSMIASGGSAGAVAIAEGGMIAGNALAGIVDQAISMINIMAAILENPEFQSAMSDISGAFGAIGGALYSVPSFPTYQAPTFSGGGSDGSGSSAADDMMREREQLERRLLELQGNTVELRRRELAELHPLNRGLQELIWSLEDAAEIAREREGLERRLLELQGDTAELRRRELEALDESNRALQEQIWALEQALTIQDLYTQYLGRMPDPEGFEWWTQALNDGTVTLEQMANHFRELARVAEERNSLEQELLQLQGDTTELRRRELEALDESNRALQEQIWALEDAQTEFGRLAQEMSQMMGVIQRLIAATGRVDLQRMFERAQLPAEAGPLLDAIYAIEDAQRAYDALSRAIDSERQRAIAAHQRDRQALVDQQQAERQALVERQAAESRTMQELHAQQIKAITDEVNALRTLAQAMGRTDLMRQLELMSLEPVARGIQEAVYSLEDAGTAFDGLERSISAAMESAGESVERMRRIVGSLRGAIDGILGADEVMSNRLQRAAQAELSTMAIMTRLTGALPDAERLDTILSRVGTGPGAEQFATREDMLRERYRILADLRTLADAADAELTTEEQALEALQSQLDAAREQLDVLRGIDNTLLSVDDAMTAFAQAITAAQLAVGSIDVDRVVGLQAQADALQLQHTEAQANLQRQHAEQLAAMDRQHAEALERMDAAHEAHMQRLDQQLQAARDQLNSLMGIDEGVDNVDNAIRNFDDALQAAIEAVGAVDMDELVRLQLEFMQLQNDYEIQSIQALTTINTSVLGVTDAVRALLAAVEYGEVSIQSGEVPGFATGGLHSGGMRLVGERGPELEVTGPSRIHTAQQIVEAVRGNDAAAEIRMLRAEVAQLRADTVEAQYQIAKFSQRTAKQLERWDGDGLPEEREEMV